MRLAHNYLIFHDRGRDHEMFELEGQLCLTHELRITIVDVKEIFICFLSGFVCMSDDDEKVKWEIAYNTHKRNVCVHLIENGPV